MSGRARDLPWSELPLTRRTLAASAIALSAGVAVVVARDVGVARALVLMLPAWSFVVAGWIAARSRPGNRIGLLMLVTGLLASLFPGRYQIHSPLLYTASSLLYVAFVVPAFILILAFPTGRLRHRFDRVLVALAALFAFVLFPFEIVITSADYLCRRCAGHRIGTLNLVAIGPPSLGRLFIPVLVAYSTCWVVTTIVHLVLRWHRASPPARRVLGPVVISTVFSGAALAFAFLVSPIADVEAADTFAPGTPAIAPVALLVACVGFVPIPFGFLAGLMRTRVTRTTVGELLVQLAAPHSSERLPELLAQALGDRTLQLAFVLPAGGLVDSHGHTVQPPPPTDEDRAMTIVDGAEGPLAALLHDPALSHDEGLIDAVAGAARLALENARLQAELRAQLEQLRESRKRIVEAGDRARRRVERDLHDGAQQRLVGLALSLRLAERALDGNDTARGLVEAAISETQDALAELRELARGLHPQILTAEGLGSAVRRIAGRAAVHVDVEDALDGRLPEQVEACAYFVCSEALQNVDKYASATRAKIHLELADARLSVSIADDGVGGARIGAGSGLLGIRDRVEALGGRIDVVSAPGEGTRIEALIPSIGD